MKNPLSIAAYCLLFAMPSISWTSLQEQVPESRVASLSTVSRPTNDINEEAFVLYETLNLSGKGLSAKAFAYAYKGYKKLLDRKLISRADYLTICDLSQSSRRKRLYIVDLSNEEVVLNTYVAHGRNSGGEYATRFSNRAESRQTSLGFYVTRNTYFGEHGLSLRMDGLEKGYNDKAAVRNIVLHGADYIGEKGSGKAIGRSYGCPAVPRNESNTVINMLKNGSCIFIYHPSPGYLHGSKILNG